MTLFSCFLVFLISLWLLSSYFYSGIASFLKTSYIIPKRFYYYFLFLVFVLCVTISNLIFEEGIPSFTFFLFTYSSTIFFLFKKGFKLMQYYVIKTVECCIKINLFLFSSISIIAIALIFYSIFANAFKFIGEVGITNFLFKSNWRPDLYLLDKENSFGIIPLIIDTLYITLFSIFVAFGFGLLMAIYLSEYAKSKRLKFALKSLFEVVSGMPSIFYGFLGAFFIAPYFVKFGERFDVYISLESIIVPSIAIGIMMIPYVVTLLDDAFSSIPKTLKDSAIAMGLTRYETIKHLVLPVSIPEIISTIIIVISRVLGETMVVLLTCGVIATMKLNPLLPSTTITVQIVYLLTGDTSFDTVKTLSVFALSLFLFIVTMVLNIISIKIKNIHKV